MSAVNDLEMAGEAIPLCNIVVTFTASDKEWESHTILCDTWPGSSVRNTVGEINK